MGYMLRFDALLVHPCGPLPPASCALAYGSGAAAHHSVPITSGSIFMTPRNPSLAVDCVVFDPRGRLLLIRRKNPPFQGQYALPGGYVDYGETTEHAAARELAEETGLVAASVSLVGVYSDPDRDPRGHVVSVAYRVETTGHDPRAGDDAAAAAFVAEWETADLAFDHRAIVADAVRGRSACR
jgi:8-oxo-dGTP diphosphatase